MQQWWVDADAPDTGALLRLLAASCDRPAVAVDCRGRIPALTRRAWCDPDFYPRPDSLGAVDALGRTPLHYAAAAATGEQCARLVEDGVPIDATDCQGSTALLLAVHAGNLPAAAALLDRRAVASLYPSIQATPLLLAIEKSAADWPLFERLVRACDLDHMHLGGLRPVSFAIGLLARGVSTMRAALCARVVRALGRAGADVNAQDATGNCPLHYAVLAGSADVLQALLEFSPGLDTCNGAGLTPLLLAVHANALCIAAMLLRAGASPAAASGACRRPLAAAVHSGLQLMVDVLLRHGATPQGAGPHLLRTAQRRGDAFAVKALLQAGAHIADAPATALHAWPKLVRDAQAARSMLVLAMSLRRQRRAFPPELIAYVLDVGDVDPHVWQRPPLAGPQ